jgi:hypothetical protein
VSLLIRRGYLITHTLSTHCAPSFILALDVAKHLIHLLSPTLPALSIPTSWPEPEYGKLRGQADLCRVLEVQPSSSSLKCPAWLADVPQLQYTFIAGSSNALHGKRMCGHCSTPVSLVGT